MKSGLKFKLSICLVGLLFLGTYSLRAQEENFSSPEQQELKQHPELNLEDDKTLIMEVDQSSKPAKAMPSNGKDSNNGQAKKTEANKTAAKEKVEEDPLNFNFLYFIIQRFKISDIVDD